MKLFLIIVLSGSLSFVPALTVQLPVRIDWERERWSWNFILLATPTDSFCSFLSKALLCVVYNRLQFPSTEFVSQHYLSLYIVHDWHTHTDRHMPTCCVCRDLLPPEILVFKSSEPQRTLKYALWMNCIWKCRVVICIYVGMNYLHSYLSTIVEVV